ncbi:MAG TPA: hypothetical protein VHB72_01310 [Candidatus Saccharimonadales bacterium]|nr:hypothetical protein [Candidatus Saccharimonadales bacterium]
MIIEPQTGDKPVLAMDMDGVFLVEHEKGERPDGYRKLPGGSDYFSYNPEHAELIQEILPRTDAYWLSGAAPETLEAVIASLELPDIPRIDCEYMWAMTPKSERPRESLLDYKKNAIGHIFPGRSLIWLDDWLDHADFSWAERRSRSEARTLLVRPDSLKGLQRHHVSQMLGWLGRTAC